VDWGDGNVEAYSGSTTSLTHTYTDSGDKTVKLQGITRFYNGTSNSNSF